MQDTNNKVSLGCGTLILIALIVMFFGNSNSKNDKQINNKLRTLQGEVSDLKFEVMRQSEILKRIQDSLKQSNKSTPPPAKPMLEAPLPEN